MRVERDVAGARGAAADGPEDRKLRRGSREARAGQQRLVVGAVVGDDPVLPVGIGLGQDAAHAGADPALGLVGRGDDGDGLGHGHAPGVSAVLKADTALPHISAQCRSVPLKLGPAGGRCLIQGRTECRAFRCFRRRFSWASTPRGAYRPAQPGRGRLSALQYRAHRSRPTAPSVS